MAQLLSGENNKFFYSARKPLGKIDRDGKKLTKFGVVSVVASSSAVGGRSLMDNRGPAPISNTLRVGKPCPTPPSTALLYLP